MTIEEIKEFDNLLAEFNNKLLELKFKQTKKNYNMISSMSQLGTYIPQEVLHKKDIKKMQKEIHNELKEEIKEKKKDLMLEKKEKIKHSLRSRVKDVLQSKGKTVILEGDAVFQKEINLKNLQLA